MALLEMIVERLQPAVPVVALPPKTTKLVADEPCVAQLEAPHQLAQELAQNCADHKGKIVANDKEEVEDSNDETKLAIYVPQLLPASVTALTLDFVNNLDL